MTSTQDTKEQARQTASTAADESKHLGSVVGNEGKNVAGEAKDQVRGLLDEALGQVDEQSRGQRDRLVGTLKSLSSDLDDMAASSGGSGLAAQLARQVADRSRSLGSHLDGREPADVLDDVRRFARQRPAVFLLGALGAGVAVGRLARGAKQAKDGNERTDSGTWAAPTSVSAPSVAHGVPPVSAPSYGAGQGAPHLEHPGGEHPAGTGPQGYLP